jgi:hypothetical protein
MMMPTVKDALRFSAFIRFHYLHWLGQHAWQFSYPYTAWLVSFPSSSIHVTAPIVRGFLGDAVEPF